MLIALFLKVITNSDFALIIDESPAFSPEYLAVLPAIALSAFDKRFHDADVAEKRFVLFLK
jgi:hypothetical protein